MREHYTLLCIVPIRFHLDIEHIELIECTSFHKRDFQSRREEK